MLCRVSCLVILFTVVAGEDTHGDADAGARELGVLDDASNWVSGATNTVKETVVGGYESTADWWDKTSNEASGALDRATKSVKAHSAEIGKSLEEAASSGQEAMRVAGLNALRQAFSSCTELAYVIRTEGDKGFSGIVDTIFAPGECLIDISSTNCHAFIHSQVAEKTWTAMTLPLKALAVSGPVLFAIKAALKALLFDPYVLAATKPGADMIHEQLIGMDIDTGSTGDHVSAAKAKVNAIKHDVLRQGEAAMIDVCAVIDLPLPDEEVSDAQRTFHEASCSVALLALASLHSM